MRTWFLATISTLGIACGGDPSRPDAATGLCSDLAPLAPTFGNVQRVFTSICTTCHTTGVELDLGEGVSYGNLVNKVPPNYAVPPTNEACGGLLVKPGDPAGSYLYQKLSSAQPCAGSQMPANDLGIAVPLAACEQAAIHDWIVAGAPND